MWLTEPYKMKAKIFKECLITLFFTRSLKKYSQPNRKMKAENFKGCLGVITETSAAGLISKRVQYSSHDVVKSVVNRTIE